MSMLGIRKAAFVNSLPIASAWLRHYPVHSQEITTVSLIYVIKHRLGSMVILHSFTLPFRRLCTCIFTVVQPYAFSQGTYSPTCFIHVHPRQCIKCAILRAKLWLAVDMPVFSGREGSTGKQICQNSLLFSDACPLGADSHPQLYVSPVLCPVAQPSNLSSP